MENVISLFIGIMVLLVGIPIGNYLASVTKEELSDGQKWFRSIIVVSLVFGLYGLVVRNDFIFFSGFFVMLVTSRSLRK